MAYNTQHELIDRPPGISGYRPAVWCAVCGYKATENTAIECEEGSCPNVCHTACLAGSLEFHCGNTGELRVEAGILHPLIYLKNSSTPMTSTSQATTTELEDNEDDVLKGLNRDQLLKLVVDYRNKYSEAKGRLSVYDQIIHRLPDTRSYFTECIGIIDSLIANHLIFSCDVRQVSVACSARERSIDKDLGIRRENKESAEQERQSDRLKEPDSIACPSALPNSQPPTCIPSSHEHLCTSTTQHNTTASSHPPSSLSRTPAPPSAPTPQLNSSTPSTCLYQPPATPSATPQLNSSSLSTGLFQSPAPQIAPTTQLLPSSPPTSFPLPRTQSDTPHNRTQSDTYTSQPIIPPPSSPHQSLPPAPPSQSHTAQMRLPAISQSTLSNRTSQQSRCSKCRRRGHSNLHCPRNLKCDYCQGAYHTIETCRIRKQEERQDALLQAIKQVKEEALDAIRGNIKHHPNTHISHSVPPPPYLCSRQPYSQPPYCSLQPIHQADAMPLTQPQFHPYSHPYPQSLPINKPQPHLYP